MRFKVKVYTDRGVNELVEVTADNPAKAVAKVVASLNALGTDVVKVLTTKRMKEVVTRTAKM